MIRPILVTVATLGLLVGCRTTAGPDVRAELDDVYLAYGDAYLAQDLDAVAGFLDASFEGRSVEGRDFDRQAFLDRLAARFTAGGITGFSIEVETVERVGSRWIARIHEEIHFTRGGLSLVDEYVARDTWVRRNGRWLALRKDVLESVQRLADA